MAWSLVRQALTVFGPDVVVVESDNLRAGSWSLADFPVWQWTKRRRGWFLEKVFAHHMKVAKRTLADALREWRLKFREPKAPAPCKGFGGRYWCRRWDCPVCRRRLFARLQAMGAAGRPTHFVTLTHRLSADVSPDAIEKRLQQWIRFLRKGRKRRVPGTNEWVWEREPMGEVEYWGCVQVGEKKGMVHLHLLMRLTGPLRLPQDVQEWERLGGGIVNKCYHLPTELRKRYGLRIHGANGEAKAATLEDVVRYVARYASREAGKGQGSAWQQWAGEGYRASANWLGMTVEQWDKQRLEAWRQRREAAKAARHGGKRAKAVPVGMCLRCGQVVRLGELVEYRRMSDGQAYGHCSACSEETRRLETAANETADRAARIMQGYAQTQKQRRKRKVLAHEGQGQSVLVRALEGVKGADMANAGGAGVRRSRCLHGAGR